jgi:hypothetical protein
LKTKYDALEARVAEIQASIVSEPKEDQGPGQAALKIASAQAWAAGQALDACIAANTPPPPVPIVSPQQILDIVNVMTPEFLAQATAALQSVLNTVANSSAPTPLNLVDRNDHEFPLAMPSEWIQPLAPDTEYDDTIVGVTGWAVNPRIVNGDFPFSHPFRNALDVTHTPFDYEFSLAMDRPATNPSEFDFLLTPGNKAPSNASNTDERAQDENYAHDLGLNFPLGLLGVEIDGASIPRDFYDNVKGGYRMAVFGRWIVDTGHNLATQSGTNAPRAEIHPPLLMAAATTTDPDTTRVLFTSRPYLVGETFTPDTSAIYDDDSGNDGTFITHMGHEVAKVNTTFLGIPTESTGVEAHPKIKTLPFRGVHLMHFLVRPPARPALPFGQAAEAQHLEVSYCFTVRSGCAVEVTSSAPDTIDVWVGMNSTGYKKFPLPHNQGITWSRDELAALNSSGGTAYLGAEALSAYYQVVNPLGGLIAAGVVDYILSNGVLTDSYDPSNDLVNLLSTQGAVNNAAATNIPQTGITHNDGQPFPVYGWLQAMWVTPTFTLQGEVTPIVAVPEPVIVPPPIIAPHPVPTPEPRKIVDPVTRLPVQES